MNRYKNFNPLRKYVAVKKNKNSKSLNLAALTWLKAAAANRLSYEIDWLGIPVIQTPEDLILIQELIFQVKPDFIIETGIAHGGGLIFYASIMELLNRGRVIGIDVEIRKHNLLVLKKHPLFKRITLIENSSVSLVAIKKLKKIIPKNKRVIVVLDSNHTKIHVLKELELYKEFVSRNCYFVVCDTFTSVMAKYGIADKRFIDNGPNEAIIEFLRNNNNFLIDTAFNKLYISYSPNGFIKRIK